ncbi:MAG: porphobilinogen synthase [Phycisphaerae bacterium]
MSNLSISPSVRPRRLRLHPALRDMLAQNRLAPSDFVAPLFVRLGENVRKPIASMPGVFQFSPDIAVEELRRLQDLGLKGYILFGVTEARSKDATGSHAHDPYNAVCQTLRKAKSAGLTMLAMTDLCYCEYTSHGHCGPLTSPLPGSGQPTVDNDATIAQLAEQAIQHSLAGADVVAPSGMMDNAVEAIRTGLDKAGRQNTAILAYAVKYASAFYGPFRDAAESPPQFGDRKSYQMDFRRDAAGLTQEALREAQLDVAQGADMVMVKPGMPYLDILQQVSKAVEVPTAVYHVSGEYAMLKAAAQQGWIDEKATVLETMYAFKRAGASFILTYYAAEAAGWL